MVEGLMADPGCRVILYDRPGTVVSDVVGGLADATDSIHATLAQLGVGPVVVIGQSLAVLSRCCWLATIARTSAASCCSIRPPSTM